MMKPIVNRDTGDESDSFYSLIEEALSLVAQRWLDNKIFITLRDMLKESLR